MGHSPAPTATGGSTERGRRRSRAKTENAASGSTRVAGERNVHTANKIKLEAAIAGIARSALRKIGGKEKGDRQEHQHAGRLCAGRIRQREVFPRGELGNQSRTQDNEKKRPLEDKQKDQSDENRRRNDPFHDFLPAYRGTGRRGDCRFAARTSPA